MLSLAWEQGRKRNSAQSADLGAGGVKQRPREGASGRKKG